MAPVRSMLLALAALPAFSMGAALPEPQTETADDTTAPVESIVGGSAASSGEFPYIVSLQYSGSHFCGGSLLDGNTVITAAHCAEGFSASEITIRAGTTRWSSGGTTARVSRINIHPNWNSNSNDYDVAILTLSSTIPTTSTIGYVKTASSGQDPAAGSDATVAGWGTTREGGSVSRTLQKVTVPVVSRSECRNAYGASAITDRMWCAGEERGGKDSCQGDSGGPIVDASGTLIGLVSWGEGCARAGLPGVYTRVGSVTSFISQYI